MGLLWSRLKALARPPAPRRRARGTRAGQAAPPPQCLTGGPASLAVLKGPCRVVDGDTLVIDGTPIRLAGIDAPELDHPYGRNARSALIRLCRGQVVTAIPDGSSTYDRIVATCRLDDGRDLSAEMVKLGMALDWATFSGGRYRHLKAEDARKRLWRVDAKQKGRLPP